MGLSYEEAVAAVTAPGAPFAIREELVRGRRMKVFERTPPSLRAFFQATRAHGEREFLVYEDERWSFARVHAQADAIGALLAGRYGVRPGDRVAIAMRNYPEWITSFVAVTSIGAIAVSLNAWWTADELAYGLEDSGSRVLIADVERIERAAPALRRLGTRGIVVRAPAPIAGVDRLEDVLVPGAPLPAVDCNGVRSLMLFSPYRHCARSRHRDWAYLPTCRPTYSGVGVDSASGAPGVASPGAASGTGSTGASSIAGATLPPSVPPIDSIIRTTASSSQFSSVSNTIRNAIASV